jgi:hypothetical protein
LLSRWPDEESRRNGCVRYIFASTGLKAGVNENGLENCHQDSTMLKLRRFSR